jgi:type IV secretory pathway VirB4 component
MRLQLMMAVLERMLAEPDRPELRNRERTVLSAAIEQTYRTVLDRTPILSDLIDVLVHYRSKEMGDAPIARSLAAGLRIWTTGTAGRLLNRQSTVELTTDCAAFDLKGLEGNEDLQAVVLLVLSGVIWNLVMRDRAEKKVVVFDEVWRLLASPASSQLIAELYRTARKYRCSVLSISQSVEDFTSSPIAAALINNSSTAYLLRHRSGHDLVAGQFHLNDREREVFRSLEMRRGEFTEALVLHGDHHFLARIVLSPLEYWLATTHPPDIAEEEKLAVARRDLSRFQRLQLLAARFPRGVEQRNPHEAPAA